MNEQQEYQSTGLSAKGWVQLVGAGIVILVVIVILAVSLPSLIQLGPIIAVVIAIAVMIAVLGGVVLGAYYIHSTIEIKRFQSNVLRPNALGMLPGVYVEADKTIIQGVQGVTHAPVPQTYSPQIHNHNDVGQWAKAMEQMQTRVQQQIAPPTNQPIDTHIPSFREALDQDLIGPGQTKMLICHELIQDDDTDETVAIEPYLDDIENNSTLFLGGSSKSGKSTYMAHLGAQGALMNALYYVIDPHLMHAEKSVAKKLEALSHAFILPPARTEADIWRVLNHAKSVAEARRDGRETPYGDRQIIFILDEVLAVLGQAHHTQNKDVILMYRDLALFLRDLGTQYAKFGVSGIIASQYVTKDAFKLPAPAGNIDFRDGCQNQILMRLPANQAQAMRLITAKELRGVRQLPQGHGYMGVYTGEVLRMASGNVTRQDIEYVATLTQPSPDLRKQYSVPNQYPMSTQPVQGTTLVSEHEEAHFYSAQTQGMPLRSVPGTAHTGPLTGTVQPLVARSEQGTASGTVGTGVEFKKRFTPEQEIEFLNLYKQHRSIKVAITKMHISYGDYQAYASFVVRQQGRGM